MQPRHGAEGIGIDVRLVEPVEQHKPVGAGEVEPACQMRQRGKNGDNFTATGIRTVSLMEVTMSIRRCSTSAALSCGSVATW